MISLLIALTPVAIALTLGFFWKAKKRLGNFPDPLIIPLHCESCHEDFDHVLVEPLGGDIHRVALVDLHEALRRHSCYHGF